MTGPLDTLEKTREIVVFDFAALADSAQQFAANSEDLRHRIDELEAEANPPTAG